MDISIRQRGVPVDDVLREDIKRHISTALRAFEPRISKVEFLLEELNLRRNESDKNDSETTNEKGDDKSVRAIKSEKKSVPTKSVRLDDTSADNVEADHEAERIDSERKNVRAERMRSDADKYCQILVSLRRGALLKVEDTDSSVTTLVARAADRVGRVVSKRFERDAADRNRREKLRIPVPETEDETQENPVVQAIE